MRPVLAILLTCIITEIYGYYLFDLMSIMNLTPAAPPTNQDITTIDGPTIAGEKTKALLFGDKTPVLSTNSSFFAYIGHTVFTSTDYTFATHFKITGKPTATRREWTFITLKGTLEEIFVYFSIGFEFKGDGSVVEGEKLNSGKIEQTLFINQRTYSDRTTHRSSIPLKNAIVFDQWMQLVVRIQVDKFTVSIDCKEIGVGKLSQGQTERFAFGGVMTFTQSTIGNILDGRATPEGRFVGALHEPIIINGKNAFDYYNPCIFVPVQIIPSEPLPEEYDPTRFEQFVRVTSENVEPIRIYCLEEDGTKHFSGTSWKKTCYKYDCINGITKTSYTCRSCTDAITNKVYMNSDKWIDSKNPCQELSCNGRFLEPEINSKTIQCQPLNCDKYGIAKRDPATQCCDKCNSDTCPADQKYYTGCERKCTDGADFTCSKKTNGCWCPEGHALDDQNRCIPVNQCHCKVGTKTYLPGQSAQRSNCAWCICVGGSMVCLTSC